MSKSKDIKNKSTGLGQNTITAAESRQRLFSYLAKGKSKLLLTILSGVLTGFFQLLSPLLIAQILDAYSVGNFDQSLNIIFLAISYILTVISSLVLYINVGELSNSVANEIRVEAFDNLSSLSVAFYDTSDHGDTISRLTNDIYNISFASQQLFQQIFSGAVVLIGSIVLMYSMSWKVATLVVVLTPFSFLVTSTIARSSNQLFYQQSRKIGELQGYSEEMITGQKLVRAFAAEDKSQEQFDTMNEELYVVGQKTQFISSLTNPGTRLVNNITYVFVGIFSSILAVIGELTIGQVSVFLNYALQFSKPVNDISAVMTEIQQGIASAGRVFEIIDLEKQKDESNMPELIFNGGEVEFSDLSFSYTEEQSLINDLNLQIEPGQSIAIVGPTGAGKTTLVNLLMRFYEPQKGAIYLDGQNIADIKRNSVRGVYGMVLQDTWLLRGSIFDNIAYGKANATEEEVYQAAKASQAHGFIMQLPDGYNTKLEDAGGLLSEGQKQLLTIARVFIADPEMLILDEATSDIDTRTELIVQEAFDKLMQGKTSFVIAHRLSTIRNADLIIVMVDGDIVETGNHEELLDKRSYYSNLYHSQYNYSI